MKFMSIILLSKSEIYDFFAGNFFANILSLITIILAGVGVKMISDFKKKQLDAAYGFHTNLLVYIEQLLSVVCYQTPDTLHEQINKVKINNKEIIISKLKREWLSLLSNKEGFDKKSPIAIEATNAVSIAEKFINFLSVANNQVPPIENPKKNKDKLNQWNSDMELILKRLCNISMVLQNYSFPEWEKEETYANLVIALTRIKNTIKPFRAEIEQYE